MGFNSKYTGEEVEALLDGIVLVEPISDEEFDDVFTDVNN